MHNPHLPTIGALPGAWLAGVTGGARLAPDAGGGSGGRTGNTPTTVTIPEKTLGVRPEDCGPAGMAWHIRLNVTRVVKTPLFPGGIPHTQMVEATQCK